MGNARLTRICEAFPREKGVTSSQCVRCFFVMKKRLRALAGAGVGSIIVLVASSAMAFPFFNNFNRDHRPTAVPEINGSGAATAAAIVLGGAAVILSRRRKRSS